MFQSNAENEKIIQNIEQALTELSADSVISYKTLCLISGVDVQHEKRYLLARAIELAEKSIGCVFDSIRNEGIKRLLPAQSPTVGLSAIRKCRSVAKRGKKRIDRINGNSMSESEQRSVRGYSAMLGAVALISDGRKASAVAAVADPTKSIPPENILAMFERKAV